MLRDLTRPDEPSSRAALQVEVLVRCPALCFLPRFSMVTAMRTLLACLVMSCVACSGEPSSTALIVRDSAGVRIVSHRGSALQEVPSLGRSVVWTLEGSPELEPGTPAEFTDAVILPHHVAVLSKTDGAVFLLPIDSADARTFGRSGDGPGEFGSPVQLFRWSDTTLAVWDDATAELSVWDTSGVHQLQIPLPPGQTAQRRQRLLGRIGTEVILAPVGAMERLMTAGPHRERIGHHVDSVLVRGFTSGGEPIGRLLALPGVDRVGRRRGSSWMDLDVLLGRQPYVSIAGPSVVLASAFERHVTFRDATRPYQRVELPYEPVSLSREFVDRVRAVRFSDVRAQPFRPPGIRTAQDLPVSDTLPPFTGLRGDRAGGVWIGLEVSDDLIRRWVYVDSAGMLEERLALPMAADILDAVYPRLLVRVPTSSGLSRVELLQVASPPE